MESGTIIALVVTAVALLVAVFLFSYLAGHKSGLVKGGQNATDAINDTVREMGGMCIVEAGPKGHLPILRLFK